MKVMDILKTETKAGTAFTKSWHKAIRHCLTSYRFVNDVRSDICEIIRVIISRDIRRKSPR